MVDFHKEGIMINEYRKIKNLFLRQSYLDAWEDYERSIRKDSFIKWDYIVLTASNEEQAEGYRKQIAYRLENSLLPDKIRYMVISDPQGKRVGSGGATFNVLKNIAQQHKGEDSPFKGKRVLVIHSGGDSKRIPQYSVCGKLFSPVPHELPNGRGATLFDEFMISMSSVPSRIKEGMVVLSGDVLLLFNALQIDVQASDAVAISMKASATIGQNHGVFLNNGQDLVQRFLHKQSVEQLEHVGAVNSHGDVDLDTGAIIFGHDIIEALYSLISTDGIVDLEKFNEFVNEEARISFYGDFLYPLAQDATREQYLQEEAEGTINVELQSCRRKIWDKLHPFALKLVCLSPAEFIHFGTTKELHHLVTEDLENYEFLDWKKQVMSVSYDKAQYTAYNSYVGRNVHVGTNSYIEHSFVLGNTLIGDRSIISNLRLENKKIPPEIVLHGVPLKNGKKVVRIYGIMDNPKENLGDNGKYLGIELKQFVSISGCERRDIWKTKDESIWEAELYPVCKNWLDALDMALVLYGIVHNTASDSDIKKWKTAERISLKDSFQQANIGDIQDWEHELENRISTSKFIKLLEQGEYYKKALQTFGKKSIGDEICRILENDAEQMSSDVRMRIYYTIAQYVKENNRCLMERSYDYWENKCFKVIQDDIFNNAVEKLSKGQDNKIYRDKVEVNLPLRVNWGGGWTDTPPFCNENGGVVLNAAIKVNGIYPVKVKIERINELCVKFECSDSGAKGKAESVDEIIDCNNPYDAFALHKAALIACGIVPMNTSLRLYDILNELGGGIYLSTEVVGIPKGSGLGTSSILAAACVQALFMFLGKNLHYDIVYQLVLSMEQIMSTGGGWQDQVGGLVPGIKFITTEPGIDQQIHVEQVDMKPKVKEELQKRFALIYTGQRRLARNLLRDVVGNYIGAKPEAVDALKQMGPLAALMKFELERGNIDQFAHLLSKHWELSKQLDSGSTNTCIDQIFFACQDLIEGQFIAGAGGGGFLQVILKRGVTREMLDERLNKIFQDSGVKVWDAEFVY